MKPVDVLIFGFAADNVWAMYNICHHNSQQHEISRYNARGPDGFSIVLYSGGYQPPASSTFLSERTSHQQPAATSQQHSSLRTNQHQPSATSQPNRLYYASPLERVALHNADSTQNPPEIKIPP
jgi:hypothetical protein